MIIVRRSELILKTIRADGFSKTAIVQPNTAESIEINNRNIEKNNAINNELYPEKTIIITPPIATGKKRPQYQMKSDKKSEFIF